MARIAIIHPRYQIGGGVYTYIYEICRRLESKYDITIFTLPGRFERIPNVRVEYIPGIGETDYEQQLIQALKFLFLKQDAFSGYDLLWTHSLLLNLPALSVRNRFKVPVLYTFHGIRYMRDDPRLLSYHLASYLIFGRIDLIIGDSNFVTEQAISRGARARRIYPGCDADKFKPTYEDKGFILTVGELTRHKSVEIPIIISSRLNIPLKIVGAGEMRGVQEFAKKMRADVEFCGIVSDATLINMYQECSFFISGSTHEAFGLALLEASACGKPVVARNCTAIPEIVRHGTTGFLCRDVREFLQASRTLFEDSILRQKMGKAARRWAERFSWDKSASEYDLVFRLLGNQ